MARVAVEGVGKRFAAGGDRPQAVEDVSFTIEDGDFISIVGHSGSGKTTLLSILGGMSRPSSGRVLFEGTDLYALDGDALSAYRREKVGFVFQFASLLPVLTARENVLLPVTLRSRTVFNGAEKRAAELLHIKPTTLNEMIKRHDIRPRRKRNGASSANGRPGPGEPDVDEEGEEVRASRL